MAPSTSRDWAWRLSIALAVTGCLFASVALSVFLQSEGWGYDFAAYYSAAQRLADTGSPYQFETVSGPYRPGPFGLYLYAPQLAVLLLPLTALPFFEASMIWLGVRLLIISAAFALMPVSTRVKLATLGVTLLSPFALYDLNLGNVSLLVTAGTVAVWRWLDRTGGGLALAATMTLRPTMGLIALWWALRGKARPLAWTAVGLTASFLAVLPLAEPRTLVEYLRVLRNLTDVTGVPYNVDIASSLLAVGAPPGIAQLGLLASYALALAAVLFSLRRDRELSFVVAVGASLLMSPLLWNHYLTQLIIPAAFLASRGMWWGLLLPVVGWAYTAADINVVPILAIAATLLPFAAPKRGEPSGFSVPLRRLTERAPLIES